MKKLELFLCLLIIIVACFFMYWLGLNSGRALTLKEKGEFKPKIDTTWIWVPQK